MGVMEMSKEQSKAAAVKEAERLHQASYNCAEAVLGAVTLGLGYSPPPLRIATGFGGGVGRTGDICGAVTGAIMAMGWVGGRDVPTDKAAYAKTAEVIRSFLSQFREQHGSTVCAVLTGYDFGDAEAMGRFADDAERRAKCADYIRTAAAMATEVLAAHLEVPAS